MKLLRRRVILFLLKKICTLTTPDDILYSEHEKKAIVNEAKQFHNSLLIEYITNKLLHDAHKNFYAAKTECDILFPQAQIYTVNLIRDILATTSGAKQAIQNDKIGYAKRRTEVLQQ